MKKLIASTTYTVINVTIKQRGKLFSTSTRNRNMTAVLKNFNVNTAITKLIEKIISNSTREVSMRM